MSALDEIVPASFRGVPFHVEAEEPAQARAVPVHEFAGTDRWETEDHGLKHRKIQVTAYIARMEGVRGPSDALWAACIAAGPGPLVLPHTLPLQAWCVDIKRSLRKDRIGYVAFGLSFVEAGSAPFGISPLLLPSLAAAAFGELTSAVGEMLGEVQP